MQKYISRINRPGSLTATCAAFESKKVPGTMVMYVLNAWRRTNKDEFLKKWRPAIEKERPTA